MDHSAASMTILVSAALGVGACTSDNVDSVGPQGGTVVSDDGLFSLEIRDGALEEAIQIEIVATDCKVADAVGPCYDVEPRGAAFLFPARVEWELADVKPRHDLRDLGVVIEREEGWNILADREIDPDDEVLTASAGFLSSFALVPIE